VLSYAQYLLHTLKIRKLRHHTAYFSTLPYDLACTHWAPIFEQWS